MLTTTFLTEQLQLRFLVHSLSQTFVSDIHLHLFIYFLMIGFLLFFFFFSGLKRVLFYPI